MKLDGKRMSERVKNDIEVVSGVLDFFSKCVVEKVFLIFIFLY